MTARESSPEQQDWSEQETFANGEARFKVGDQWYYRGNRSPMWLFVASRADGSCQGGISEKVPAAFVPLLEKIAEIGTRISKSATSQRDAVLEEAAKYCEETLGENHPHAANYFRHAASNIRALKERAAPQEPTQHTVSPVSDSPTPAAAALQNPYAGKNPRCAKGCPPETWCAYDECPGRNR